jgi:hypothetical protein
MVDERPALRRDAVHGGHQYPELLDVDQKEAVAARPSRGRETPEAENGVGVG